MLSPKGALVLLTPKDLSTELGRPRSHARTATGSGCTPATPTSSWNLSTALEGTLTLAARPSLVSPCQVTLSPCLVSSSSSTS